MMKILVLAAVLALTTGAAPVAGEEHDHDHGHGGAHATTVLQGKGDTPLGVRGANAYPVPSKRSYTITASCASYANQIRQGAATWEGMTEGGGTPVSCQSQQFDCGGVQAVGCNWSNGQKILLAPSQVRDVALLAAHEFGHDWYAHSSGTCASWGSKDNIMRPAMC
ncbi:hypothetical protein D5S17_11375 [Pseudonocardiaceae bacterium YIM PH 21723]|nr:hypothetical protein D5S17_11375 [Pseudonocardiaceae bacterium YIM PH 21723]